MKYPSDFVNTIICGNCLDVMKDIPDKSIDLILTDPPYDLEIDQKKYSGVYATKGSHLNMIKDNFGNRFNPNLFLESIMRISKNGIIIWHSKNLLKRYIDFAEQNNYKWNIMFWHKYNPIPAHHNHQLNDTEYCIRIYKSGSFFNNNLKYNEYFTYYMENVQYDKDHPTPKPLSIMTKQLKVFTKENDLVLDCYCGTGTTCIAAKNLNRNYIGIDISEKYCQIARERLSAIPDSLF